MCLCTCFILFILFRILFFAVRLFINKCYVVYFRLFVDFLSAIDGEVFAREIFCTIRNFSPMVFVQDSLSCFFFTLSIYVLFCLNRCTVTERSQCTFTLCVRLKCEDIYEVNWVNSMIVLIIIVIVHHDSNSKMVIKHAYFHCLLLAIAVIRKTGALHTWPFM